MEGHGSINFVSAIQDGILVPAQTVKWEVMKYTAVVNYNRELSSISLCCYLLYCAQARNWLKIFHNGMDVLALNGYHVNRKFRGKRKGLMFLN